MCSYAIDLPLRHPLGAHPSVRPAQLPHGRPHDRRALEGQHLGRGTVHHGAGQLLQGPEIADVVLKL